MRAKNPTSHHLKVLMCAWKHIEGCLPRLYRYWKQEWEDWILAFYLQYAQMEHMQQKQNLLVLLQIILLAVSLSVVGVSFYLLLFTRVRLFVWNLVAGVCTHHIVESFSVLKIEFFLRNSTKTNQRVFSYNSNTKFVDFVFYRLVLGFSTSWAKLNLSWGGHFL